MKAWAIVGYSYNADTYCGDGIKRMFGPAGSTATAEEVLDTAAGTMGIDRHDEFGFDSSDFPKIIFASGAEDSRCGICGIALIDC
jgi:hypothetical protein